MNIAQANFILNGIFTTCIFTYLVVSFSRTSYKLLGDLCFVIKSKSPLWKKLRKEFWLYVKKDMRGRIKEYCKRIPETRGYTVECIVAYELDLMEYKDIFIKQGYDNFFTAIITKLEEINKFVIEWKQINEELSTEEMVQLYLNETKPSTLSWRK